MTLILTELSEAGIAMAADSLITKTYPKSAKRPNEYVQWEKIVRVPRIKAAVSYWGEIGLISGQERFDRWLKEQIDRAEYRDLPTFAAVLADLLNSACNGKPAAKPIGIHVTGIHAGASDPIPSIIHVHNGHSHIRMIAKQQVSEFALSNNPLQVTSLSAGTSVYVFPTGIPEIPKMVDFLRATQFAGARSVFEPEDEPRTLFKPYQDFPDCRLSRDQNLQILKNGFLTRNGDYAPFTIIAGALDMARVGLNSFPGISFPKHPGNLDARITYLRFLMETLLKVQSNSSMERRIGGTIRCLGIRRTGTYYEKTAWAPRR